MDEGQIWAESRKRAKAETLELLRLNSFPRILLTAGSPLAAFAATLGLTSQLAIAALATLAWTFACGLLIYLINLLRAPAKIAVEVQLKLEAAASAKSLEEERQDRRTVVALGIEAAERLKNLCATTGGRLPSQEIEEWNRAMLELCAELGPEYQTRYNSNTGLYPLEPGGVGALTQEQRNHWSWLDRRAQRLHQFLNELR